MTLHLAIIGTTGQLARALNRTSKTAGYQVTALSRSELDLTWEEGRIADVIDALPSSIDVVIIAAAYTAVDAAEDDEATAFLVNAKAPEYIAKACAARGLPLVHLSTDYVFNGAATTPYKPDDMPAPINAYGRTKLAGEIALRDSQARHYILRTSWVFDGVGKNFLTTMLRLGQGESELSIVDDQIGRPTYAGHLAEAVLRAALHLCRNPDVKGGTHHVTGGGAPVSWAGFAEAIFGVTADENPRPVTVKPIASSAYPTRAARPKYSVLDMDAFEKKMGYSMPNWQEGLTAALDQRSLRG